MKTLLFGAVRKDLEMLGSAADLSERLAIRSRLKRYGHCHHRHTKTAVQCATTGRST